MITRAVLGMGETFNWPCASRIVANTFPPSDRSLASGIFNSGAAIGSLVAPMLIGGLIAQRYGWRAAFFTIGAWDSSGSSSGSLQPPRRPCRQAVEKGPHFGPKGKRSIVRISGRGIGVPAAVILCGPRLIAPFRQTVAGIGEIAPWLASLLFWGLCLGLAARHSSRSSAGVPAIAFAMLLIVALTVNPCWYFVTDWLMKYLREYRQLDRTRQLLLPRWSFSSPIWAMSSAGIH